MITLIVAMARGSAGIGFENALPWKLKADLQFFKRTTQGCAVIMGRKTFDSLPKPLPNRLNVVLTRTPKIHTGPGDVVYVSSVDNAIRVAAQYSSMVYVIGGAEIYAAFLPIADEILVTEVRADKRVKMDTFFPTDQLVNWTITEVVGEVKKDENNQFDFTIFRLVPPTKRATPWNFTPAHYTLLPVVGGHYHKETSRRKSIGTIPLVVTGRIVQFDKFTLVLPANARTISPYFLKEYLPRRGTYVRPLTDYFSVVYKGPDGNVKDAVLKRAYDAIGRALLLNGCTIV